MLYDRYYYSTLNPAEQKIYKQIYDGIEKFSENIIINKISSPMADYDKIIEYIGLDNPHLFYVDFALYRYADSPLIHSIKFTYWYTPDEVKELNRKVQNALNKMLHRVSGNSEYEKEKSVHNLLIDNILYDRKALANLHQSSPRTATILGVLFYKTAVCEGIAKIVKMLLNMLDIKCIVAIGTDKKQNCLHAWNIVKIGGKSYHLDVTWDLDSSLSNVLRYDYFNLTDNAICKDHTPEILYPQCISTDASYHIKNGLVINNINDINEIVAKHSFPLSVKIGNGISINDAVNLILASCPGRMFDVYKNLEQRVVTIC